MSSRIVGVSIYRLLGKISTFQARLIRMTMRIQNRFQKYHDGPISSIPICVRMGIDYTLWRQSWRTDVIRRLANANGGVFIDVGANLGQTLLDLFSSHPSACYVGFEPNVSCVFYLNELIRVNSFGRCHIIPAALSDKSGCVQLFRHQGHRDDTRATIMPVLRPGREYDVDVIPCVRFDDIYPGLNVGDVQFVKIDVEGSELETLLGMSESLRAFRPIVLCEVLFADSKADLIAHNARNDRLLRFLGEMHYSVLQLIKSADDARVVDVSRIQNFASAFWTRENKDLCDYLFVPSEKETAVLHALLPGATVTELASQSP